MQNLQLLLLYGPTDHVTSFTFLSFMSYLSESTQTCVIPLCQSEFACGTADLILVEAGHQFSAHFDVGASVAPLLVVI